MRGLGYGKGYKYAHDKPEHFDPEETFLPESLRGRRYYEPTEHGHHYHLIDIDSGKVIEFQDAEHERVMQAIAARLGFDLVSMRLELFGRRREAPADEAAAKAGSARRRAKSGEPEQVLDTQGRASR